MQSVVMPSCLDFGKLPEFDTSRLCWSTMLVSTILMSMFTSHKCAHGRETQHTQARAHAHTQKFLICERFQTQPKLHFPDVSTSNPNCKLNLSNCKHNLSNCKSTPQVSSITCIGTNLMFSMSSTTLFYYTICVIQSLYVCVHALV